MQVELRSIGEIKNYDKNARNHDAQQIAQIKQSMTEFGFNNPILVDEQDVIIAGHARMRAAKELGLKVVPTIKLTHLSETQKRAYILADNQIAMNATWDLELLKSELSFLASTDFNMPTLGFEMPMIDIWLSVPPTETVEEEPALEPKQPEEDGEPVEEKDWDGMPEFDQVDKTSVKRLIVHFKTLEDYQNFGQFIDQPLTDKTRSIWYPKAEIETMMDKRYES